MKLIADSGSTKTNWALYQGTSCRIFKTEGINLHFMSEEKVGEILNSVKLHFCEAISSIHFYGAGVSNIDKVKVMSGYLNKYIDNSAEVHAFSDFLGACRALFGKEEGVVSILGTGASTGVYNGVDIIQSVPSLGFWLGDEGSGSDLGKRLIKAYLRDELPLELKTKFEEEYGSFGREHIFEIMATEKPNAYFATFVPFLKSNLDEEWASHLVSRAFDEFVKHNLLKYDVEGNLKFGFVGSVAFYFQDLLKATLAKYFDNDVITLQNPMQGLIDFHVTNVQ
ncbi:hypothetical protein [Arcticibacterium luteifluviistationis]|uniref:N-acetylglucosamine kinase n=1 Tax=Arcticibacterium luteifluviistationis TaxID=1784714 RepID=A0A2Z4GF92_9BACT|nr:hypothetical protein [Arcticibacterium luteifluviistationis]AWV99976.1 hypothetical protein DJ013_18115 [Arcticibacterium luteifluviistationis]